MASDRDLANLIKTIPLFGHLSRKNLTMLAGASSLRPAEAQSVVVHQDEPADSCFLILEGSAIVRRDNKNVAELGVGDVIGELAILDGAPRFASVTMTSRGELLEVGREGFAKVLADSPDVSYTLMLQLAERLRQSTIKAFD